MPEFIQDQVVSARTVPQMKARLAHANRAEALLALAEEWIDCDVDTMNARGYGWAAFLVDLANLHLRIRDLL